MKTISDNITEVMGRTKNRPGYLVEVAFVGAGSMGSTIYARYSTIGTLMWNGYSWAKGRIKVTGISQDTNANNSGQIIFGADPLYPDVFVSYALDASYGFTDRPIKVWAFYYDNVDTLSDLAIDDAVLVFDGVGDSVSISAMDVSVTLSSANTKLLYAPRHRISKVFGFNFIQPKGLRIPWGAETFVLG